MATTDEKIISLGVLSYNNDKMKDYIQGEIDKIPSSAIDDTLSDTSEHPVQNKVVNAALNSKADASHNHNTSSQTTSGFMSAEDKEKLDNIEEGANKIIVDSSLSSTSVNPVQNKVVYSALLGKASSSHTHDSRYYTESEMDTKLSEKMDNSIKGVAGGVAELDSSGKVPASQLPSYVDDVLEYSGESDFPTSGETGKIYVDTATNKTYRWSGSGYTEISASLALGTTSSTAYRGDRGLIAYNHSQSAHAPSNAEANVQSDWNVTDTSSDAYILNKPTKLSEFTNDAGFITSGEIEGGITYTLSKSGSTITLTGSDGSTSSVTDSDTNTKNTTGSTNTSNKIFLVGATSQTTSSTTYSHDTAYVGTDGCLYSDSKKTVTTDDSRLSDARIPTAHNQASDTINTMTGYSKPTSTSAIATSDTLNTAIGKLEKALDNKADSSHTHSEYLSTSGTASSATKLATARTIQTNLGSTSSASFNGTANITPGVTGTLPIANGGTGATTASAALTALGAAASSHTHNDYVNQNAFSNVVVGSTTVVADTTTDTLTLAGSNVTITPDTTNDKITIGITKENVTDALGYTPPTSDTTYENATTSAAGLMSATDKEKLDGIEEGANNYSLPTASSTTLGGVKTTSSVTSVSGYTACPIVSGVPYYKDTKVTVDSALSSTSTNPVQNKIIKNALDTKAESSTLTAHTGNADIHVTTAEKSSWNSKAELSDIPTSLPADGGNADTVDGKHASDFALAEDKYYLSTFNSTGIKYVNVHRIIAKHNVKNDGRFYLQDEDTHQVRVNYSDGADTANTAGTLAATKSNICLRNLSSGTAAATTDNCPNGAWYGKHS